MKISSVGWFWLAYVAVMGYMGYSLLEWAFR